MYVRIIQYYYFQIFVATSIVELLYDLQLIKDSQSPGSVWQAQLPPVLTTK